MLSKYVNLSEGKVHECCLCLRFAVLPSEPQSKWLGFARCFTASDGHSSSIYGGRKKKTRLYTLGGSIKTYVNLSIVNVCLSAQSEGVLCDKAFPRSCNTQPLSPDRELTAD